MEILLCFEEIKASHVKVWQFFQLCFSVTAVVWLGVGKKKKKKRRKISAKTAVICVCSSLDQPPCPGSDAPNSAHLYHYWGEGVGLTPEVFRVFFSPL